MILPNRLAFRTSSWLFLPLPIRFLKSRVEQRGRRVLLRKSRFILAQGLDFSVLRRNLTEWPFYAAFRKTTNSVL